MKRHSILAVLLFLLCASAYSQSYSDFETEDIDGNTIRLSSFVEKGPVMLGFWRSYCSSCKEEQRNMQSIYEKYRKN